MQGKFKRFFSVTLAIILAVVSLPVFAAAAPTYEQILNASVYIIIYNEGTYTSVLRDDNGALSIGKIGWHATNALNLLKEITARNPSQALNILGTSLYNEIVTSTYWETRILSQAEAAVIGVLLSTAESQEVQDATAARYINSYLEHGIALGITEPESLVFFADYENQNGYAGAASFYREVMSRYGTITLATLYECSSKNARRTRTYNFCATINWNAFSGSSGSQNADTTPPTITDITLTDLTSKGFTVSCAASDDTELSAVYYAVYYRTDGIDGTKWYKYTGSNEKTSHTVNISEFASRAGDYCTFIYAFDAAGNYSYVGLNVITVPEEEEDVPFALTVSTVSDGKTDKKITWRAKASGGSGNYQYSFTLYRNGTDVIGKRSPNDFSDYSYTADKNGVYSVLVEARDMQSGKTASVMSADVNIFDPIVINTVTANKTAAMLGETITWTTDAAGGEGNLKYSYTLYKDGVSQRSTDYTSSKSYTLKPTEPGIYSVTVTVADDYSQTEARQSDHVTVTKPLSVSNISFSKDYAVVGSSANCSVEISGGSGSYTCIFSIYCDGELVTVSEPASESEFTFTVTKIGTYTAAVTVTDTDGTVITANGGTMTADEKPQLGDVNGDGKITSADARFTLRYAAKLETADDATIYAMDINGDGKITSADARKILRAAAKLEELM